METVFFAYWTHLTWPFLILWVSGEIEIPGPPRPEGTDMGFDVFLGITDWRKLYRCAKEPKHGSKDFFFQWLDTGYGSIPLPPWYCTFNPFADEP